MIEADHLYTDCSMITQLLFMGEVSVDLCNFSVVSEKSFSCLWTRLGSHCIIQTDAEA